MRVVFYVSDLHACGHVRGEALACAINEVRRDVEVVTKGECTPSDLATSDVMVFQRQASAGVLAFMREAQRRGIACIYDLDDDLWAMPDMFPGSSWGNPGVQERLLDFVTSADTVTASTLALGEQVAARAPDQRVAVIRNGLDLDVWRRAHAVRRRRVAEARFPWVTLGWMASRSHLLDVPLVFGAIEAIMQDHKNVRLHCIGSITEQHLTPTMLGMLDRIQLSPWMSVANLPGEMTHFDVGLAPLVDCPYNRGKSGIKALQYWALEMPVVASRLPMYEDVVRDCETGLLVDEKPEDWRQALDMLVTDEGLRANLGAAGRLNLVEHWDMRCRIGEWLTTFRGVRAERRAA